MPPSPTMVRPTLLTSPHSSERLVRLLLIVVTAYSALLLLTDIVLQAIVQALPRWAQQPDVSRWLQLLGVAPITSFTTALPLLSTIAALVVSALLLFAMTRYRAFRTPQRERRSLPKLPTLNTLLIVPVIFLVSVGHSSLFNAIYFVVFVGSLVLKVVGKNMWEINDMYATEKWRL